MTLRLTCSLPTEDPLVFVARLQKDDLISDLFKDILTNLQTFGRKDLEFKDLYIYKTDIPSDPNETLRLRCLQWLHENAESSAHRMRPIYTASLESLFPNPSHGKIDIVVADSEVLELVDGLGDPNDSYNRKIKKDLDLHLDRLSLGPSPSETVHSSEKLANVLGGAEPPIHVGRPGGIPAVLFNPALATLQKRLDDLDQIQVFRTDIERATDYLQRSVKFFKDESARQEAIQEILNKAIGENGVWDTPIGWADNIRPNAVWWTDDMFLNLAIELKNTLGLRGDAVSQAVLDYVKIVSKSKLKRFHGYCNFPVVLVGITANRIEISVAVCQGPIYVTRLLTVDLSLGFHASNNIIRLAQVFKALSLCQLDLKDYYRTVQSSLPPKLSALFPSPLLFKSSTALPKLTYWSFVNRGQPVSYLPDLGNVFTVMYIATLNSQEVIVKFTPRYNKAAHLLLTEAQLAPRLHFCERVVGDLYMVVMDRIDGKSVWQLMKDKIPVPKVIFEKVKKAVHLLHQEDIVFGDLREPNILYDGQVYLVDFDWPGKDKEARYPATLNANGDMWADDVLPFGIMCKDHDMWQLKRLEALCSM